MFIFRLLKENLYPGALAIVILAGKVNSKFCNGGHFCSPPKECCTHGCCYVFSPGYRSPVPQGNSTNLLTLVAWNHWFLWCLLLLLFLSCLGGCGLWRRRQFLPTRWCSRSNRNDEERSEPDSVGSCYPPPHYSRCSFHHAPPPYTEVTSKPDLYPLVISYGSENGKIGDNYLMVQYLRNYIVRPALGSLSAESTADSIGSSFLCQSANETDSNVPPPYEEPRIGVREESELPVRMNSIVDQSGRILTQMYSQCGTDNLENRAENGLAVFPPKKDRTNAELQQVMAQSIHHSIQKASLTMSGTSRFTPILSTPFHTFKTLPSSIQSCSRNLNVESIGIRGLSAGPQNFSLSTFKQVCRSALSSTSDESIHDRNAYAVHKYTPDVILAQPQSYCEPTNELHYDSVDVIGNPSRSQKCINDSFSSEDNLSQARGSLQDFVSSDGLSHSQPSNLEANHYSTSSDVSSLQGCGTPDSPPKATSPTCEFRDLLDKIQQLPTGRGSSGASTSGCRECSSDHPPKGLQTFQIAEMDAKAEGPSEGDTDEGSLLLSECREDVDEREEKEFTPVRPNKLLFKKSFPSKSKTFYMPFCHGSIGRKAGRSASNANNSSFSAPVTPVSPGNITINFLVNSKKLNPKKGSVQVTDFSPLLQESGNNDELF